MLTSGSVDLSRVPASRRVAGAAHPPLPRSRRASTRAARSAADRALLASAERSLGYVSRTNRELAYPERSTVVRGGSLVYVRRPLRAPRVGETAILVRVGGERSAAPAVASLRVGGRTVRVGAGESFDSPGARAL